MESYNEFLNRINSFQKPELELGEGDFEVNPSLKKKVQVDNSFAPFYGDTVVFDLDDTTKEFLADCTDKLYKNVPNCFCENLVSNTFHMTLHDLSNSPVLSDVAEDVFKNEIELAKKVKAQPVAVQTIEMESTCIFNMVNTSLVMGLNPINENEYEKLMELYNYVDSIRGLPYPLTPHITLAYYNRNGFSYGEKLKLENVVNQMNKQPIKVKLNTASLFYQKFMSMNDYISLMKLF